MRPLSKSRLRQVHEATVIALTQGGYRHIDEASIYENEQEVGTALTEVFSQWQLSRSDVWITTKLWNTDHARARVEPAARKSMKLLGVDYLDALLIHWPVTGNRGDTLTPPIKETWQARIDLLTVRPSILGSILIVRFRRHHRLWRRWLTRVWFAT